MSRVVADTQKDTDAVSDGLHLQIPTCPRDGAIFGDHTRIDRDHHECRRCGARVHLAEALR